MSVFVVDSSVGVKWLVPEDNSDEAMKLQDPKHDLHIPSFFDVELGNVLWKKVQRQELSRMEAETALAKLPALPLTRHSDGPLVKGAFDLAITTQRTVYDCMYLSLAILVGGKMVTADEKLVNGLTGTAAANYVIRVQEVA